MDTRRSQNRIGNGQRLVSWHLYRWTVLSALLVSFSTMALSAQTPAAAKVELPTEAVVAGSRFELKLRIPDTGISVPVAQLPALPSRLSYISGPDLTQDAGIDEAGQRTRYVYLHYIFRANSSGYVEFPPVNIVNGTQSFRSDPVLIGICGEGSDKKIPPDLVWNVRSAKIFEGQAIYLTLDLRFAQTIAFPDKVEVAPPQGGLFEEVRGLGQIETEKIAGQEFPRVPVATYIFTPATKGAIALPAARISYGTTLLNSQPQKIQVEPLPAEVATSGAIGDLRFSGFLNKSEITLGEQFLLTLRVEGDGNLNFLHIPEPTLGDLVLIGRADNSKFTPSESGYRGFRETVYRLSGTHLGSAGIALAAFNWIDPQGNLQITPASSVAFSIVAASANHRDAGNEQVAQTLSVDEISLLQPWFFYRNSIGLLFYLPGALLLLAALVRGWGKRRGVVVLAVFVLVALVASGIILRSNTSLANPDWRQFISDGNARYAAGDFQAANSQYTRSLRLLPDSPGIMYNLAISCFGKNANAQGMYYLQKALRILPGNDRFRSTMRHFEQQLGLDRQLPLLALPAGDVLFLAGAVFLAMAGLFLLLSRRYRSVGLIAFSLFMLALVGTGTAFFYGLTQMQADVGIISETGGAIRKIPDKTAAEWLTLKGGTSVLTIASSGNFYLVETSYGVKGWLDSSVLYHEQRTDYNNLDRIP